MCSLKHWTAKCSKKFPNFYNFEAVIYIKDIWRDVAYDLEMPGVFTCDLVIGTYYSWDWLPTFIFEGNDTFLFELRIEMSFFPCNSSTFPKPLSCLHESLLGTHGCQVRIPQLISWLRCILHEPHLGRVRWLDISVVVPVHNRLQWNRSPNGIPLM